MIKQNIVRKYVQFGRLYGVRTFCTSKEKSDDPQVSLFRPIQTLEDAQKAPKRTVTFNGKTYNYPWKGAWEEDYTPELWQRLYRDGIITSDGRLKHWLIKDRAERLKVQQLWYQMDDGKAVYEKGYHDRFVNYLVVFGALLMFIAFGYSSYYLITPKEKNIFEPDNWKRWHHEHHD